ncbi:MAG: RagB/SusD family nutrient uptake outer membrane protein [Arachidicoccus sp.]|nr:RagB/SusD family nutrient uptake outer membrane protein [Arachidicoccus sp.]
MKNKIVKNILMLSIILSGAACKKQLDLSPYGTIALSQSFQTISDAKSWDNGFYSSLRGNVQGGYILNQDFQADQTNASLDFGNNYGSVHRWGTDFAATDGALSGPWSAFYVALKNINLCIENFPTIKTTSTVDSASLNQYLGDAYLARAYYYSELVIRFAKPYESSSAAKDLGVPLVLTYDVNEQPARATVQETYDQILSDIAQAKTLLAGLAGSQSTTTFNIDVATALEARVRLYMQDWAGAMTAANALISGGKYPLATTQAALNSMWTNDISTEVIFQSHLSEPNELGNANGTYYLNYNSANGRYDPYFIPTQAFLNLYSSGDYRIGAYFSSEPCTISATNYTLTLVNKYPGNPNLWTGSVTNYQNAPKIFRIAEQYLIYAEAAAETGSNDAKAQAVLNELRTARNAPALSGLTGTSLLQAVRDERTRELAFEGFRLWDLKRWHQGFTRGTPQNLNAIMQGESYNLLTIDADDYQFVWGIPTNDIQTNPNLVQNTGW